MGSRGIAGRRRGGAQGGGKGARQGDEDRGTHARGRRVGRRARRRAVLRARRPGPGRGPRRGRAGGVQAAARCPRASTSGLDETAFHEPANLSYPSGAHCCVVEVDRETGRVRDPAVRRRGRLRHGDQPADGEGADPRRGGPGHRPGIAGGGPVRRRRPADHRYAGRLHGAGSAGPAAVRDRPHRDEDELQPARREGPRRVRGHRRAAGGGQCGRRRAVAPRASATSTCPARRRRCGGWCSSANGS